MRIALAASCVVLGLASCGARTGLEVAPRDAFVVPDGGVDAVICAPDVVLLPARADVLLVLDRSGSMTRALASSSTTRWDALQSSLRVSLPSFDADVAFGATIFPIPDATIDAGTVCTVGAQLDVPVALGSAPAILDALAAHAPSGGTPTADAIAVATNALVARARTGVSQSIVLATDGGPNCDPADASQPWFGQAPETCAESGVDPELCLDRMRTIARIGAALSQGIPTYVIAMDVSESYLVDVLRQMATAGGRARTNAPELYYDVRNPSDLNDALADVRTRVSTCSFFPDGVVTSEDPIVEVGNDVVSRDDSRTNGWTRGPSGTFDLYGPACDLTRAGAEVHIVTPCH